MNQLLGGHLLRNTTGITVNVHHPDVEVQVEVRNKATYVTSQQTKGLGGLPVGTGGKSLLLLSGGIDSPVAGYRTINADRKSTRLNSSHVAISYAVFCLKKKNRETS